MDQLETRTDPLGKSESYAYDLDGNLTTFTDRDGNVTTYQYDALNRLTFVGYGTSGSPPTYTSTINYAYDAGNRLTQAVDSVAGTFTPTYDELNRLTEEQGPEGTVSYQYDNDGRRTQMTVSGQSSAVTYAYDNDSRLTGIAQGTSSVSFAYDAAGRRTSLTLPDGVVVKYGYDSASELTGLTYSDGAAVLGNLTYAYDADGRRTQVGGSWARIGMPSPTTSTASYNVDNELTNWDGNTLTYDPNGNMTSDSVNTYTWNARNELSSISGLYSASFEYGPFGRRQQKTINGTTTDYLYDGVNPVQELSGTTVTANMLTGLGVDEYFTRADSTGTSDFLDNALGSAIALADTTGAVQTQYTYSPFGTTSVQGAANANSYQFTGRENDGQGLYYYRARYYDPTLSRFISEDPFGFVGGQSDLHAYVGDSPTEFVDPSGHEFIALAVTGLASAYGGVNEGVQAYACGARGVKLAEAIGRGMAAGAVGGVVGLYIEPFDALAGGAAGGAAYTAVNSFLQTGHVAWSQVPLGAALGGLAGAVAEDLIPNGPGRSVNVWKSPRTLGPKAVQHYSRDIIAGAAGTTAGWGLSNMAGTNCGCQ